MYIYIPIYPHHNRTLYKRVIQEHPGRSGFPDRLKIEHLRVDWWAVFFQSYNPYWLVVNVGLLDGLLGVAGIMKLIVMKWIISSIPAFRTSKTLCQRAKDTLW